MGKPKSTMAEQILREEIHVFQFEDGTQGRSRPLGMCKRIVHEAEYEGPPSVFSCASLPVKKVTYHWVRYMGVKWCIEKRSSYRAGDGEEKRWELWLPDPTVVAELLDGEEE